MTLDDVDRFCRSLPGSETRYPFEKNPHLRAWCLNRKMFAWTVTNEAPTVIQLKADPDMVPSLIESYACVAPGYHMNKRHWVSVNPSICDDTMLAGLLEDAHNIVARSLPKASRRLLISD